MIKASFLFFISICLFFLPQFLCPGQVLGNEKNIYAKSRDIPADSIKKNISLLKKLLDKLKFTKNARIKEKARIVSIDSILLHTAKLATETSIHSSRDTLNIKIDNQYKDLHNRIQELKKSMVFPGDTSGHQTLEKNIKTIIDKIVAMLHTAENSQVLNLNLQKRIVKIHQLYGREKSGWDTLRFKDSSMQLFKLKLKQNASIIGFVSYKTEKGGSTYNYNDLSGVNLYAVQLSPGSGKLTDHSTDETDAVAVHMMATNSQVYLSVFIDKSIQPFLSNKTYQDIFYNQAIALLKKKQAYGINIYFGPLPEESGQAFTRFISGLYERLKNDYMCKISVTVPGNGSTEAYNLLDLNPYVNSFIIDFTRYYTLKAGPLDPLKGYGHKNIQSVISRFTNTGISSSKLLLGIPYRGIRWSFAEHDSIGKKPTYLSYAYIRDKYHSSAYNADTTIAFSTDVKKDYSIDTVWYDDENTLAKKYDYLLMHKLGGVALVNLSDENDLSELWDVLTDKFISIDTVMGAKLIHPVTHARTTTLLQRLKMFYFFFNHPCEQLFIPSIYPFSNTDSIAVKKKVFDDALIRIRQIIIITNIVLSGLFIICSIILIHFVRREGEWWPWRKPLISFMIVEVHLFILVLFMLLFLVKIFPWFGHSTDMNHCVNMPFHVLICIIVSGLVVGMLVMRFLFLPFMQKENTP